jgi:hypothetical protein
MGRPPLGPDDKAGRKFTIRLTPAEADLLDRLREDRSVSDMVRLWLSEAICTGSGKPGYRPRRRGRGARGSKAAACAWCHRKFAGRVIPVHTREGLVLEALVSSGSK